MATLASKSIDGANQWTDAVQIIGWFNVGISGTFSSTVITVQRSTDNSTWNDVDTWTAPSEDVGMDPELMWYRIGCKTGEYSDGPVTVRIGQDGAFHA